jgi:hypothetical protein
MRNVETLHQEAMELVDQAVLARQRGDATQVAELSRAAFQKESAAANLVANQLELEPTPLNSASECGSSCIRVQ